MLHIRTRYRKAPATASAVRISPACRPQAFIRYQPVIEIASEIALVKISSNRV